MTSPTSTVDSLPINSAGTFWPTCAVIQLTRLNNSSITINSDVIKFVQQSPDTVITLLNGEKILVRESVGQILDRVIEFRRRILSGVSAWHMVPAAALPPNAPPVPEDEG